MWVSIPRMPKVNIWIRKEDMDMWNKLKHKSLFVSYCIQLWRQDDEFLLKELDPEYVKDIRNIDFKELTHGTN